MPSMNVGEHFAWSTPKVVVEACWWFGRTYQFGLRIGMPSGKAHFDSMNLSDELVECDFHRDPETDFRSLLRTGLENSLLFLDFSVNSLAFAEEMGYGLFAVDILTTTQGFQSYQCVPMVWSRYNNRINIIPSHYVSKVGISIAAFVGSAGLVLGIAIFNGLPARFATVDPATGIISMM
jgi:hypothetical protein